MSGLVCAFEACRRTIGRAELGKRAEVHRVAGEERVYGEGMPDGSLAEAGGPLVRVYHGKCWFAQHHRTQLSSGAIAWRQVLDDAGPPVRRESADWRGQEACDVEELRGVVGRADRGDRASPH